jgi:hypothetical protein
MRDARPKFLIGCVQVEYQLESIVFEMFTLKSYTIGRKWETYHALHQDKRHNNTGFKVHKISHQPNLTHQGVLAHPFHGRGNILTNMPLCNMTSQRLIDTISPVSPSAKRKPHTSSSPEHGKFFHWLFSSRAPRSQVSHG